MQKLTSFDLSLSDAGLGTAEMVVSHYAVRSPALTQNSVLWRWLSVTMQCGVLH